MILAAAANVTALVFAFGGFMRFSTASRSRNTIAGGVYNNNNIVVTIVYMYNKLSIDTLNFSRFIIIVCRYYSVAPTALQNTHLQTKSII